MKKILSLLLVLLLLVGCSSKGSNKKKFVKDYVSGTIEALFKGNITDDYLKAVDGTREETMESYQSFMENEVDFFAEYFELVLNEANRTRVRDVLAKLYGFLDFQVQEPSGDDKAGYTVKVNVKPVESINKLKNSEYETFKAAHEKAVADGTYEAMASDQEREDYYADLVIKMFEGNIDEAIYGYEKILTIGVTFDGAGLYDIADEDLKNIVNELIVY